jgi:hypothetical protein
VFVVVSFFGKHLAPHSCELNVVRVIVWSRSRSALR